MDENNAVSISDWVTEKHYIERLWPSGVIECACRKRFPWEEREAYTEHIAKSTLRARTTAYRTSRKRSHIRIPLAS